MLKNIEAALTDVRNAAREQSDRMQSELSAGADALLAAKAQFEADMKHVSDVLSDAEQVLSGGWAAYAEAVRVSTEMREEAETKKADALRQFDTAMTNLSALMIALQKQIASGDVVTGIKGGEPRRPQLVKGGADA
jgi:chromosome segregation ATPase